MCVSKMLLVFVGAMLLLAEPILAQGGRIPFYALGNTRPSHYDFNIFAGCKNGKDATPYVKLEVWERRWWFIANDLEYEQVVKEFKQIPGNPKMAAFSFRLSTNELKFDYDYLYYVFRNVCEINDHYVVKEPLQGNEEHYYF